MDPIDDVLRRFCHVLGVPTKELDADRPLAFIEVEILAGPFVAPKNAFGGNELRDQHVGPALSAKLPENLVRHTCHRSEVKRKGGKPGKIFHLSALPRSD